MDVESVLESAFVDVEENYLIRSGDIAAFIELKAKQVGIAIASTPYFVNNHQKCLEQTTPLPVRRIVSADGRLFSAFFSRSYSFSNHFSRNHMFQLQGIDYFCVEHFYMYYKAKLFDGMQLANSILNCKDPATIKRLGSSIKTCDLEKWRKLGIYLMIIASIRKYEQNPDLKQELLQTQGTTLVECNPRDTFWGIGLGMNNSLIADPNSWRGQNVLGFLLTKLRDRFMHKYKMSRFNYPFDPMPSSPFYNNSNPFGEYSPHHYPPHNIYPPPSIYPPYAPAQSNTQAHSHYGHSLQRRLPDDGRMPSRNSRGGGRPKEKTGQRFTPYAVKHKPAPTLRQSTEQSKIADSSTSPAMLSSSNLVSEEKQLTTLSAKQLDDQKHFDISETHSSLLIEKIPTGQNSITALAAYFTTFGTLKAVHTQFEGLEDTALVTYNTHNEALLAYNATTAILNNRHVTSNWYRGLLPSNKMPMSRALIYQQEIQDEKDTLEEPTQENSWCVIL